MGLNPYTCTATDADASNIWDGTTAGTSVAGLIYEKGALGAICMREDLRIINYDDPIHDLVGINLLMRFGVKTINEEAGCLLYYK